jgi:hypothetical protein
MRTETWSNYQERLIWEANKQIELSERILGKERLRKMGQLPLEGWEEGAKIIPFPHRYKTPDVHEINDLTA